MKKIIITFLILILVFSFTGCSLFNEIADTQAEGTGQNATSLSDATETSGQDNSEAATGQTGSNTSDSTSVSGKMIEVTLYFANEDNSALKKEKREVQVVEGAILKACIFALIDGPETQGLRKTIPEGTTLRGISVKDKVATVDFSSEFQQANGVAEIVARLSVVNTLTEINGIEKVHMHIDGEDMIGPSGMPLGDMGPALLDEDGKPAAGEMKTVTLYFSDSQAMYVVPEKREITQAENESIEKAVLMELMKGPVSKELHGTVPNGTKLLSIGTKNGICTVDLSSEFVDNSPGGTASERMTLGSVVNTLTELSGVNKVQFLINGEKQEIYTHAIFDEPFSRDESLIKT